MPQYRITSHQLVCGCYILASYLFLGIVLAIFNVETVLIAPGIFLFERFHVPALYIPSLFVLSGVVIKSGRLPRRTMLLLRLSPVPFLTSAVMFQLASGNTAVLASRVMIESFGRFPASMLCLFLLVIEIAGLAKLASIFTEAEDRLFSFEGLIDYFRFPDSNQSFKEGDPAGSEEPTLDDRPQMSFPSFPDAPEPMEPPEMEHHNSVNVPSSEDQVVFNLVNRVLTGSDFPSGFSSEDVESPVKMNDAVPESPMHSAFPENDVIPDSAIPVPAGGDKSPLQHVAELLSDSGQKEVESIGANYSDNEHLDNFSPEEPDWGEHNTEKILSVESRSEENQNITNIADKRDSQESEPLGILRETPIKPRPGSRKKYDVPIEGLLADYPESDFSSIDDNTRKSAEVLEKTLKEFRIEARVTGIRKGPVITMFELLPSPGVKISSIVNLQDNIALRLAASRVRIIAPIPGKHAVGIEVPNRKRSIVSFSSLVLSKKFAENDAGIPVILGKDISGGNQIIDLTRTPHLLIAGATGSGKSVCVNALIGSILYSRTPQEVKMIMVDPKIVELKLYNDIPHLLTPVITNPKRAIQALQWCLSEMERRYALLDTQGVRDIKTFNKRVYDRKLATESLPYIVVLVDEFADLMATSGKELEAIVARLAAMSRAVGIHLVLATQRPSVDVITGLIKANFPSRIAFMVAGKTDSRIIIDSVGAEKLLGRGDMLFTSAWDPFPSRIQGAFLAEEEVERLANHVKSLGEPEYIDEEMFIDAEEEEEFHLHSSSGDDPMYEKALEIVVSSRKASASYLQRRLKIGYNRAARLVEEMEQRGIVGPANGSKPRDLIHIPEHFLSGGNASREPSSA